MHIDQKEGRYIIVLCIITSLYVIVNSTSTNPYYFVPDLDSQIFRYMGFSLLHGKIPYTDIFDHKGPFLYIINALGLLSGGKAGILLLQILSYTFSFTLLYLTFAKNAQAKYRFLAAILTLSCTYPYYLGGNLTEEWSLPLNVIPFYLVYNTPYGNKISFKHLFIIGLCFGLQILLRANNIAPVIGLVVYYGYNYLKEKDFSYIAKAAGTITLGLFLPLIITVIAFYIAGGTESVRDAYFGIIGFNLEYTNPIKINSISDIISWGHFFYLVFLPILASLVSIRKHPEIVIPSLIGAILIMLTIGANRFQHYLLLYVPLIFYSFSLILEGAQKRLILAIVLIPHLIEIPSWIPDYAYGKNEGETHKTCIEKIFADNPECKEVWNAAGSDFYDGLISLGITQTNRVILPFQMQMSKTLHEQEYSRIDRVKPKYVLYLEKTQDSTIGDTFIYDRIRTNHDEQYILSHYKSIRKETSVNHSIIHLMVYNTDASE